MPTEPDETFETSDSGFQRHGVRLAKLTRSRSLGQADVVPFLREVTETASETLEVERVSVWLYHDGKRAIRCADLFERAAASHTAGAELLAADYPTYFETLETERAIAADHARRDPRTAEFTESYLTPLGITSMLDAPVRTGGEMVGVICFEHVGPRRAWTREEQSFAASVADIIALGFEMAERRRAWDKAKLSDERYRTLAANFPNGAVLLYDRDLRYIVADGTGLGEIGLSREGLEGKTIWEALPKDACDNIEPYYRGALAGERSVFEMDFHDRVYRVHVEPVSDGGGAIVAGMVMTQDITEQRRAEDELRRNAVLLSNAQSMAHLGVFEWRADTNRVTWSDELYSMFGLGKEDFGADFQSFLARVHPDDRDKVRTVIEDAYRNNVPFQQEERIVLPDGSERVLASKGEPIVDDNGDPVGILGTCLDITDIKRAHALLEEYSRTLEEQVAERTRELREKQAQLVQSAKMASLGGLVAGIVHEINNPLGAMWSSNDVVRRTASRMRELVVRAALPDDQRARLLELTAHLEDATATSHTAGERVATIVSSLKEFASLDQPTEAEVDVHEGIESTLALVGHLLGDRIVVRREFGDVPRVRCYPDKMNQAYMNLLLNAIQAIRGRGEIVVRTRAEGRSAVVEIADTGVGIPPENIDRIFDPGFTTKGVKVGTGLGLSIVHRVMEEHGGAVEVDSTAGSGSTFRLRLPLSRGAR